MHCGCNIINGNRILKVANHNKYNSKHPNKTAEIHFSKHLTTSNSFLVVNANDILTNQDNNQWYKDGLKLVQDNLKVKSNTNTAKNAILFVGDGMGYTTITATRILDGQMKGHSGEENVLSWESFPWSGQAKTYNVDTQGADSAASATAFMNGIKTLDSKWIEVEFYEMMLCQKESRQDFIDGEGIGPKADVLTLGSITGSFSIVCSKGAGQRILQSDWFLKQERFSLCPWETVMPHCIDFSPSVFMNKLAVVFYDQTTQVPLSSLLHSKESL